MTVHLLEAIEINTARKPLYAKLTNNKSLKISRMLTLTERMCLMSSYPMDTIAKYWQKRNVPVMVHEFIPMDQTPEFNESFTDSTGIADTFPNYNTKSLEKEIMNIFKQRSYEKLSSLIDEKIGELEEFPKHYCMIRHMLESIRRSSNLTLLHINKSAEYKIKSPETFCRYLLYCQIAVIHSSSLLDKWSYPLQKDGIPILFQDVPYIPAMPEIY